jgi:hypothetical protein
MYLNVIWVYIIVNTDQLFMNYLMNILRNYYQY